MAVDAKKLMSEVKFYESYSRWLPERQRKETWEEAVERVMDMHRHYYREVMTSELEILIDFAEKHYKEKHILGSQRALQFGGEQLLQHQARLYNCTVSHVDRPAFFNEAMYLLLCGAGVGFSVQQRHISQLPTIRWRDSEEMRVFSIPDSIEGWADSFAVLLSSYFTERQVFPEFAGCKVVFDFSRIRPKGAPISGGFKAPGPEPLRRALEKVQELLEQAAEFNEERRLRPIQVYDIVMHMADAVIAGGVRRSATICLFDFTDLEMLRAKTGNWWQENPQRGRSNNSAIIERDKITEEEFMAIFASIEQFGEPGFVFTDNLDFLYNPCVEIGMYPKTEDGRSGFEFCNL